ncbi:hypothetical protein Trydic_g124 [Trypoxylus dichotomus]
MIPATIATEEDNNINALQVQPRYSTYSCLLVKHEDISLHKDGKNRQFPQQHMMIYFVESLLKVSVNYIHLTPSIQYVQSGVDILYAIMLFKQVFVLTEALPYPTSIQEIYLVDRLRSKYS